MKKVLYIMFCFVLVFMFSGIVYAKTEYYCDDGYDLDENNNCVKVVKSYQRNGFHYCDPANKNAVLAPDGINCIITISAKTREVSDDNPEPDTPDTSKIPDGYVYKGAAKYRDETYYCENGWVRSGTGCYGPAPTTTEDPKPAKPAPNTSLDSDECPIDPNSETYKDLIGALNIMKIAGPLLVIGFTIFEFIKATASGDSQSELKKLSGRLIKRMIFCVLLFAIPILVEVVLKVADVIPENGCSFTQADIDNGKK